MTCWKSLIFSSRHANYKLLISRRDGIMNISEKTRSTGSIERRRRQRGEKTQISFSLILPLCLSFPKLSRATSVGRPSKCLTSAIFGCVDSLFREEPFHNCIDGNRLTFNYQNCLLIIEAPLALAALKTSNYGHGLSLLKVGKSFFPTHFPNILSNHFLWGK